MPGSRATATRADPARASKGAVRGYGEVLRAASRILGRALDVGFRGGTPPIAARLTAIAESSGVERAHREAQGAFSRRESRDRRGWSTSARMPSCGLAQLNARVVSSSSSIIDVELGPSQSPGRGSRRRASRTFRRDRWACRCAHARNGRQATFALARSDCASQVGRACPARLSCALVRNALHRPRRPGGARRRIGPVRLLGQPLGSVARCAPAHADQAQHLGPARQLRRARRPRRLTVRTCAWLAASDGTSFVRRQ